jgi:hypothetical protein
MGLEEPLQDWHDDCVALLVKLGGREKCLTTCAWVAATESVRSIDGEQNFKRKTGLKESASSLKNTHLAHVGATERTNRNSRTSFGRFQRVTVRRKLPKSMQLARV